MPQTAQRMVWLARAVSAVALVIGIYAGAVWAAAGETLHAFLFLAIAVAYVLLTWVSLHSPLLWVAIGGMVTVLVILDPGVITVTLAVASGILFWMRGRRQASSIDPARLRALSADSIMPGAEGFVDELSSLGWRQVGAYGTDGSDALTVAVLLHPDRDCYAEVTDMVIGIESRFADGRYLVSRNSGWANLPPNYLTNDVLGASPTELAEAHREALDLLATQGDLPMPHTEDTVVAEAVSSEATAIEWSRRHPSGGLFNFGGGFGALDESAISAQRIEAWMAPGPIDPHSAIS